MTQITIVRAKLTCMACPSQWDAWTDDGQKLYFRYRYGHGTARFVPANIDYDWYSKAPFAEFSHGDGLDGSIALRKFCELANISIAPSAEVSSCDPEITGWNEDDE